MNKAMLSTITRRYLPSLVRAQLASPSVYPALTHATSTLISSIQTKELSSLPSMKRAAPTYKCVHAPRPRGELQDWNVHPKGTTTLSTSPSARQKGLTQIQTWNHHDDMPKNHGLTPTDHSSLLCMLQDSIYSFPISADVDKKLFQMELNTSYISNEESQNEINSSTGKSPAFLSYINYPQGASDLVDQAYHLEHRDGPMAKAASAKSPRPNAHFEYPQGASDLVDQAYKLEHPGEQIEQQHKEQAVGEMTACTTDFEYPQGASDLVDKAYALDHPDEAVIIKKRDVKADTPPSNKPLYPQYGTDLCPEAYIMENL